MPAPAHRESAHPGRAGRRSWPSADTPTTSARAVLDRLADVGLIDDADFAEQWVHSRRANAGKGKRALAAELHTKGVDNDVITAVLAGIDAGAERGRAESWFGKSCGAKTLSDQPTMPG